MRWGWNYGEKNENFKHHLIQLLCACLSFIFKSGGGAYITDGPRGPHTVGADQSELSIAPSPLDGPAETQREPRLHTVLQKQR